jgi:hypothetical protein
MDTEIPQENENEDRKEADMEWDKRILCSDGNCIGVIGADGRCKECGKRYEGRLPETSAGEKEDQVADENGETAAEAAQIKPLAESGADESPADESPADESPLDESPPDEDWENRVLCRDGNCIGIIGPDGKCKVCGKPYE